MFVDEMSRYRFNITYVIKFDLSSGPDGRLPGDVDEVHPRDVVVATLHRHLRRSAGQSILGCSCGKKVKITDVITNRLNFDELGSEPGSFF
jgi:hypothetical protein